MGDEARPVRARSQKARSKREEEVRKKYDFSVIRTLRQHRGLTIEKFAKLCGLSYAPISRITPRPCTYFRGAMRTFFMV